MKLKRKVVMLPTNEKAIRKGQIGFVKENTWIGTCSNVELDNIAVNQGDVVPQHLYIISDEEIKVGDWCIDKNNCIYKQETDKIFQTFTNSNKIITTTDKSLELPEPSPEFIDKFIREYNKGNVIEEVMVEYDAYNRSTTWEKER
jgi:hypothetical protein